MRQRWFGTCWFGALSLLAGCDAGSSSPVDRGSDATPGSLQGCAVANAKTAPGGYYTNGATVCTAAGLPYLFHGVARPSLEWDPKGEGPDGVGIPRSDFDAMASWHANVVRIALNQDFWLSGAALYDPSYAQTVDQAVHDAEGAGLDVILDLHWSDRGDLTVPASGMKQNEPGDSNQQPMADLNSKQFWLELATKYKDDGHVLFELYNEPHDVSWDTWLSGGPVKEYQALGMQQLYDTVRGAGADNIVIAGGLSYAFDLSEARSHLIHGYNVIYATHPYQPQDPMVSWDSRFGYLAAQDIAPVIMTEFGDTRSDCKGEWDTALTAYADARKISWTAWAWFPGDCHFPSLISDWKKYPPTVQGEAIQAALLSYPYEPAGVPSPAGGSPAGGSSSTGGRAETGESGQAGAAGDDAAGMGGADGGVSGAG